MPHRLQFTRWAIVIAAASLVLVACTSGSPSPSAGAGSVSVGTTSSSLGTFLIGPTGLTLYIHSGDSTNTSTCTGSCLTAWPPLTVDTGQQPVAGNGVVGHLGTFTRPDGATQVTYNGLPLYYWQGDTKAGDATGQDVNGFTVALAAGGASGSSTSGGYGY